ncbi:hypothetical protein [Marinobacterium lacunae]|uniref:hypothetical protein n=1 Tax=Marinobacterium lacunae TaxID=1232683 RepID=UPI0005669816|nr:hypothetical protein [Marinobacterium lacunae]
MENKCSLKVVSDKSGKVLSGTAAILHATSREGGFDAYMTKFAEKVAKEALSQHLDEQRKPRLRSIG